VSRRRLVGGRLAWGAAAVMLCAGLARHPPAEAAPETVVVVLPAAVSFFVTDVNAPTPGLPSPTPVSFQSATIKNQRALEISIRADSDFVPAGGGPAIPASLVSWSVSSVAGGYGSDGTLSTTSYGLVYQSVEAVVHGPPGSATLGGGFDVAWTLAAPGAAIRAGAHLVTLRWKLESIKP